MKPKQHITVILVLILTLSLAKGQDFSPLLQTKANEVVIFSDGVENGNLYLLEEFTNNYHSLNSLVPQYKDLVEQLEDIDYCFNKLYSLNAALEIEKELLFKSSLDSVNWVLNFQIDELDDDLVVFVANFQADTTKFYMHWYDLNLNLLHTLEVPSKY